MTNAKVRPGALLLATAITSGQALANGIAINEQSPSGSGLSYAGRAASAKDASTVYGNPAGMSKLKRTELVLGVSYIMAKTDIKDVHSSNDRGTNKGDMVPRKAIPANYIVVPLDDRWHVGFGLYAPFAAISDYESGFQGAGQGRYSSAKVITLQPTVSYKLSDSFSVGAGITFNRMTSTLTEDLTTHKLPQFLGGPFSDTGVNSHGDDDKWGYNLGVLWDITDRTRVGFAYHSHLNFKLDGHTRVSHFPNLGLELGPIKVGVPLGDIANRQYDATISGFNLPDTADIGVVHKLTDRWTLYAGSTWYHWDRWNAIRIHNDDMNPIIGYYLKDIHEDFYFHNTWSTAIGASYQVNKQWELRGGFSIDPSPYSNNMRGVRLPVGNRKNFTLGAGYSPNENWSFDGTIAYLREAPHQVNKPSRTDLGSELQPDYHARYKNTAWAFALGVTQRF